MQEENWAICMWENQTESSGNVGGSLLGEISDGLRDIGYEKGVVMEPFLLQGGEVARDCKVWRDLSGNADEKMLDRYIKESLTFLKHEFTF